MVVDIAEITSSLHVINYIDVSNWKKHQENCKYKGQLVDQSDTHQYTSLIAC